MNWYKKAQIEKKASMDVSIADYKYPRKKENILEIAFLMRDYLWYTANFKDQLTEFEMAYWMKNRAPEFVTVDGLDSFKSTGTLNIYLAGLPERVYPFIAKNISDGLTKEGFKFEAPIINDSKMFGSKVMRIKVTDNPHVNQPKDEPPELNMANSNSVLIFEKILGYDLSNSYAEIPIFDLMNKINKLNDEKIEENERLWSRDWGKGKAEMISGGLYSEDIKIRINRIKEICDWALSHGYKRINVG